MQIAYASLLMHPDYGKKDFNQAKNILEETVEKTKKTEMPARTILALSLLSELEFARNNLDSARSHSAEAVEYVQKMRYMPAVREEEVFFKHYLILKALQDPEADKHRDMAADIMTSKAASITDEKMKDSFLEKVPLNRMISEFKKRPR